MPCSIVGTSEALEAFIAAIVDGTPPLVSGEDGLRAIQCAIEITDKMRKWAKTVRCKESAVSQ